MIRRVAISLWTVLCLVFAGVAPGTGRSDEIPSDQFVSTSGDASLPADSVLRQWIATMKEHQRGPFKRIRWFCNDGEVLPPKPYACVEHGGGVQHGEWTDQVKQLRENGFLVANLLSDIDAESLLEREDHEAIIKQLILEQFLVEADDGWIFRRARYYRGALQDEDETRAGRRLLLALAADKAWRNGQFLVLREAVRLLPHGQETTLLTELRQESRTLAEADPGFDSLRTKLHIRPEPGDAHQVRSYAKTVSGPDPAESYMQLADTIDAFFRLPPIEDDAAKLVSTIPDKQLAKRFRQLAVDLPPNRELAVRYRAAAELLVLLREQLIRAGSPKAMLDWLDFSLRLEEEAFRIGNQALPHVIGSSRRVQLAWLHNGVLVAYGSGLLTSRQRDYLADRMLQFEMQDVLPLDLYRELLADLGRVPEWADRTLYFHFRPTVDLFSRLDPLAAQYFPDRLRGSPLLFQAQVLEVLLNDVNAQLGLQHQIYGQPLSEGLRGVNPGLTRGILQAVPPGDQPARWDADKIYLLSTVPADLPRIAGIISTGQGNVLSHVQLLARNLGIPNVVIAPYLWSRLAANSGQRVVLAVTPHGRVLLEPASAQWDIILSDEPQTESIDRLVVPVGRLDLSRRDPVSLADLRASDAGRIVGPKAANLGELKSRFPEEVTDGLVIPFGLFRQLLDQPLGDGGPPLWDWMVAQYRILSKINEPARRQQATSAVLARIRGHLLQVDPGQEFLEELRAQMARLFGPDGSYGVFVRSDTNVEDLPGFSGAGLNLTIPNVVGFDNILEAIHRVWASPFTERSFDWRQSRMNHPEQVFSSILLMRSVPVEKSGVLVTADVQSGDPDWLTVAVNAGVGGAVAGQMAEQLLIHKTSGEVRLLAPAAEPSQRVISPRGGVEIWPVPGMGPILNRDEVEILRRFTATIHQRFPELQDTEGQSVPADVEFGFLGERLALFQIRPFLNSPVARRSHVLIDLDRQVKLSEDRTIELNQIPGGTP